MEKKMLDVKADNGELVREDVNGLKNGLGKITMYHSSVESMVMDVGYIVMEPHSTIGLHSHLEDAEIWIVLSGAIHCNGVVYTDGHVVFCQCGCMHNAHNVGAGETVLQFLKWKN